MALSGCAAATEATAPTPKSYDKPASTDLCTGFDYEDAAGATRTYESDLKRYGAGTEPKQLTQLAKRVEKAVVIGGRPGDDWLCLVDGNLRVSIHLMGPFPKGDTQTARLLDIESAYSAVIVSQAESLLKSTRRTSDVRSSG